MTDRLLRVSLIILGLVHILGFTALFFFEDQKLVSTQAGRTNIYYVLIAKWEPWHSVIVGLILLSLWALNRGFVPQWRIMRNAAHWIRGHPKQTVWTIAISTTLLCAVGTKTVYHDFPFSMDEYGPGFQARIFQQGRMRAPIPQQWQEHARYLKPVFVRVSGNPPTWRSAYLPGYALLVTPFDALGVRYLLNPILAGLAILLIAALARKFFPEEPTAGPVAAAFLAIGPQFFVTSISFYSMPAHLTFNLLWLWLLLRPGWWGPLLAAPVGLWALGLHQIVPHSLFAAPFVLMLIVQRRFIVLAYFALFFGAIFGYVAIEQGYLDKIQNVFERNFYFPGVHQTFVQMGNLWLLCSWQSLAIVIFACVGVRHLAKTNEPLQALAAGVVLTFVFYLYYRWDQGHGWGYRYFYPVLGNLALVAVAGWFVLKHRLTARYRRGLLLCTLGGALLIQVPYRMLQVERTVGPFAHGWEQIAKMPEPIVVIENPFSAWYGHDMVRNDPMFRRSPVLVHGEYAANAHAKDLDAAVQSLKKIDSVRVLRSEEFRRMLGQGSGE